MMTYETHVWNGYSTRHHFDSGRIVYISATLDGQDESIAGIGPDYKPGPKWFLSTGVGETWKLGEVRILGLPEGHVLSDRVHRREYPDYDAALAALHKFMAEEFGL